MNMFSPPGREIELRLYQTTSIDALRVGIREKRRRQVLVSPTGSGKTIIGLKLIAEAQRKGSRAWFIVDRTSLVDQTSAVFHDYGIDHGVIQADHFLTDYSKLIQIVSAQTLARRTNIRDLPDLIIVDECHCQYKAVLDLIARADEAKVIGLTATPFSAGMDENWDGLVNVTTVNQLLAEGYLAPIRIKACVSPDMQGAKLNTKGEYQETEAGDRGTVIIGDVVRTWIEQTNKHFGGPAKTIVFSPSVKHGEELCRQFAEAGFNFQQISYLDKDEGDKKAKISEFRKPDSAIDGLVSCAVLTKGFDVPDCLVGISCRPYRKSFSSHVQEMGRIMRIFPGKAFGLWLDHSGNAVSFAEDTAWLFEYGVDSLSKAKKLDSEVREPKEKVRKERFCGDCGTAMEPGESACVACGWQRPARGEIQFVEGEMIDVALTMGEQYSSRQGLRAGCLKDPKAVWNAALSYCLTGSSGGADRARKWAMGIWFGIYEGAKPPRGFFDAPAQPAKVTPDQWNLVDREVRRFRKGRGK
jgi:DNA repair protein RadD